MEERNYNPIRLELINEIKNYLFPIGINGKYGTCFFFQIVINSIKAIYLCISYDLLPEDFINAEKELQINESIKIKLNKRRTILSFKNICKLISIDENDNIPDKNILETDLPSGNYINQDAYLFAYSYPFNENGGGFIPGKILNIDGYKIHHQFNTKNLLFVSPICIINQNNQSTKFKVIGVQLENPDVPEYRYMSYGYLLTYILTELNIPLLNNNNYSLNNFILNRDLERNKFLTEFRKSRDYSFYTFEQYKEAIKYMHFRLSKFYNNQTTQEFNGEYYRVNKPAYRKYLRNLYFFKNINNNLFHIFNDAEIVKNLNEILSQNNYEIIQDFSYFIAGYIYVLNTFSEQNHCKFTNDGDLLYTRMKLKNF